VASPRAREKKSAERARKGALGGGGKDVRAQRGGIVIEIRTSRDSKLSDDEWGGESADKGRRTMQDAAVATDKRGE